jgi:hypothetical protein
MPVFSVPLVEGKTEIDICVSILEGLFSEGGDDTALQMSACYFLAQHAQPGDRRVVTALVAKLTDTRMISQYEFDNARGTVGSTFFVDACAADALAALSSFDVTDVHTNHYEEYLCRDAWAPKSLCIQDGCLVLTQHKVMGEDVGTPPPPLPSSFLRYPASR